jgi:hypothetical protein
MFVEQGYSVPKRDSGYRAVMQGVSVLSESFDHVVSLGLFLLCFFLSRLGPLPSNPGLNVTGWGGGCFFRDEEAESSSAAGVTVAVLKPKTLL